MQLVLGNDFFDAKNNKKSAVIADTDKLINGHLIIVGASGVGKSHTLRRLIRQATAEGTPVRFHVFDVHGDLDIPNSSTVRFSEQTPYGLNPLRVNPDPHFGGVRKAVQNFIRTVNQASRTPLGGKQEAVIRNLLMDVFRDKGFYPDEPHSWAVNEYETRLVSGGADNRLYLEVPFAEKDKAAAFGARWDPAKKHWWVHTEKYQGELLRWPAAFKERDYPTLQEVVDFCKRLREERFLGSDQRAVRALNELHSRARAFHRKKLEAVKSKQYETGALDEKLEEELDKVRAAAVDSYVEYVNVLQTGQELEMLIKYDSAEVLKSVLDRLNNLVATGLFKANVPSFDPAKPVWRYQLNALSHEEKKMFVFFTLQNIFYNSVQQGEQNGVREVVVLDELGIYTSAGDDDDGIISTIAREARKFGLALWAASQTPANVPESLVSSVGTKLILGIDEMYWTQAVSKFRIELKQLEWIRATKSLAAQLKERGALKNRWRWVLLDEQ